MDKLKSLESTINQIERNYGKGSVMRLGQKDKVCLLYTSPSPRD